MEPRPIKFRAWDKRINNWFRDGDGFALSWDATEIIDDNDHQENVNDNIIFSQFTGLTDKNGQGNICFYEGDIIDLLGDLVGNKYQNEDLLEIKTNLLIEGIGTKAWASTEKEAMARGLGYSQ